MLFNSIKVQFSLMLNRKEFQCSFLISLFYACFSFIYVMGQFKGIDVCMIKDANQGVCYSELNGLWFYFLVLYPFLILLPFSTSYIDDHQNRLVPFYTLRNTRRTYFYSKIAVSFLGSFLVIFIPFLINLILCNAFMPHNFNTWFGEYQMENFYRSLTGTNLLYTTVSLKLPMLRVYLFSPLLYNFLYLIILSVVSGLFSAFMLSCSFCLIRKKIVLFMPLFIVFRILSVLDSYYFDQAIDTGTTYINCNVLSYIVPSISKGQSTGFWCGGLIFIVAVTIGLTEFMIRREEL